MTILPVVERELRVAARRPWTYWGRAGAALVAVLVTAWFLLLERAVGFGALGPPLFGTLSFLSFLFAALAGVTHSADSVSAEKREGTLGLLFLTDLRGFDVAFGKLAASSLSAIYGLLATFPVLALTLMLGGVTAGEYWRMVLVLANLLLLSLGLGLWMSALSTESKRAAVATFFLGAAALFLLPLGAWLTAAVLVWPSHDESLIDYTLAEVGLKSAWAWMTPIAGYRWAFDSDYRTHAGDFWRSQMFTIGLAGLSLVAASRRLPRCWQEGAAEAGPGGRRAALERWRFPTPDRRAAFRRHLLELNPAAWLAGRHWLRPVLVWFFLLSSATLFLLLAGLFGHDWWNEGTYLITSVLLHLVLKVWIASEAPRQFHDDRGSGAMELLLSTPLTVRELLHGRLLSLRRQFGGPVLLVLACDTLFLTGFMAESWGAGNFISNTSEQVYWLIFWLLRMAFLVFDGLTLAWLGLWTGMTARGRRPVLGALTRGLVLPWLGCLALFPLTLMAIKSYSGPVVDQFMMPLLLTAWLLIGAGNNRYWIRHVRARLEPRFREFATERPDPRRRWFRRVLAVVLP